MSGHTRKALRSRHIIFTELAGFQIPGACFGKAHIPCGEVQEVPVAELLDVVGEAGGGCGLERGPEGGHVGGDYGVALGEFGGFEGGFALGCENRGCILRVEVPG